MILENHTGIESLWEEATVELILRCERWKGNLKMAFLAEEGNEIDTLLQPPRTTVALQLKTIYEEGADQTNAHAERERELCNAKLKIVLRNKCAKKNSSRKTLQRQTV